MTETQLVGVTAALWLLLVTVLGWIGKRIFEKLDGLGVKQDNFSIQMTTIQASLLKQIAEGDNVLHHRVTELDRRVTRVETKCQYEHGGPG